MKKQVLIYSFAVLSAILLNVAISSSSKDFKLSASFADLVTLAVANSEETAFTCSSGGPGSSSCSVGVDGGGGGITGGVSCSVTCSGGYFACCNSYYNKCQCRQQS